MRWTRTRRASAISAKEITKAIHHRCLLQLLQKEDLRIDLCILSGLGDCLLFDTDLRSAQCSRLGYEIMLEIHPSARKSFDTRAEALLALLKEAPRETREPGGNPSEIHVSHTITNDEIIGEVEESTSDYKGRTAERFFRHNGIRFGLKAPDYNSLRTLTESIQRLPAVREKVSQEFVEETLFSWLKDKFREKKDSVAFLTYFESITAKLVKPTTVYVPIANTMVECPFEFSGAIIENISKAAIDKMVSVTNSKVGENNENIANYYDRFRSDFQGYAAVKMHFECEPKFAFVVGFEKAKRITDLLGIYYSPALLIPDINCYSKIKGTENVEQCTVISYTGLDDVQITSGILDHAAGKTWAISRKDVEQYRKIGLDILSDIATKDKVSDFESTVLNMAYLYSKAAFTGDPMAKLVYMLSAAESTLLKSNNEPIQQNLAERMAVFIATKLERRKAIIKRKSCLRPAVSVFTPRAFIRRIVVTIRVFLEYVASVYPTCRQLKKFCYQE